MQSYLDNDIKFLKGVGDHRAALLGAELGIRTMRDLLYHFPFRYIDRSRFYKIGEVSSESTAHIQLKARVNEIAVHGEGRRKRLVAEITDGSGVAELVWFAGLEWIKKRLEVGREYIIFGRPGFFNGDLSLVHPEIEQVGAPLNRHATGLQGVYSTTETLSSNQLGSKGIFALVCNLWENASAQLTETLPRFMLDKYQLLPLAEALRNIHFPSDLETLRRAEYRLKFEELFGLQLGIVANKSNRHAATDGFVFSKVGPRFTEFYQEKLSFELTAAQKKVVREIRADTVTGHQMNRLLQGDVGSGKTLVALLTMLLAADNGFQSCLMAPTEILARQHYASICKMLGSDAVKVGILTGSTGKKEREMLHRELEQGQCDILIGTHALIEDAVQFSNLGLVVIDEQHRFGVEQRAKLWTKNQKPPHILVMTATPIPRTLAMTLYGDLEVSVIDELPPGRKPIKTVHMRDSQRLRVYGFMQEQIKAGRQVYVVYPLISESEKMDYKDLEDGFNSITQQFAPPDYFTTVVHGRLKAADKEANMQLFKQGTAHIMVATSVIEVGVDVPNATIMVIESAERFGLSQLHQLRGRVGRGAEQSYCILMSGDKLSREARARIEAMVRTNDGFELSELDLKLRGSGDIKGTRQSGLAFELKIANLSKDAQMVEFARDAAINILDSSNSLDSHDRDLLYETARRYSPTGSGGDYSKIS